MKYLYIVLIMIMFLSPKIYGEDSSLLIKCPENYKVTLNGYKQNIGGTWRQYTFDFPNNESGEVKVICEENGKIVYKGTVVVLGGSVTELNLLPKKEDKPNFGVFDKTEKKAIAKPDFTSIISGEKKKAPEKVEEKPKAYQAPAPSRTVYTSSSSRGICLLGRA